MTISHWGIFPGYWYNTSKDMEVWQVWEPCSIEELVQWQ